MVLNPCWFATRLGVNLQVSLAGRDNSLASRVITVCMFSQGGSKNNIINSDRVDLKLTFDPNDPNCAKPARFRLTGGVAREAQRSLTGAGMTYCPSVTHCLKYAAVKDTAETAKPLPSKLIY